MVHSRAPFGTYPTTSLILFHEGLVQQCVSLLEWFQNPHSHNTKDQTEPVLRDNNEMKLHVHCYAGRKGDERPVRFQLGERQYLVEEIIDQWYGPEDIYFKLRADDSNIYIVRHRTSVPEGEWELVSFRETRPV